jgi:competence protein ComEC
MAVVKTFAWQKLPALRLLLPFVAGVVLQWYQPLPVLLLASILVISFLIIFSVQHAPLLSRFQYQLFPGVVINVLLIVTGCFVLWCQDVRNNRNWFGKDQGGTTSVVVTIEEPPVEKTNVFRAVAKINYIVNDGKYVAATGKVLLSFSKNITPLIYGSQLLLKKPLQEIKNAGNPGGFDYKRYCLFQGITHQAYLTPKDFLFLPENNGNVFFKYLYACRSFIVSVYKKYVNGSKEQGLAEALLIGYKDDLDKDLVKAYSNTGVVHIIAISGLHLALIYGLLMMITIPLKKKAKLARFIIVVAGLWIFSLLAGAQPSILRAAVMFTAIALQILVNRKGFIFNSIALAAFALLCYNPFWLWDAGFQLSFLAVLSIILFYKPVYNLIYIQNKSLDFVWKLAAASLAAQVLTIPVTLYYFHQFPFVFLFTNIVAVPLSSLIVYVEILLCALSGVPLIAVPLGKFLTFLIAFMNNYVERMNELPFALWSGISISVVQAFLLYGFILGFCYWLVNRYRFAFYFALASLAGFFLVRSFSFIRSNEQQLLVVYNIPKHKAIDFITGRNCVFSGDRTLSENNGNDNAVIQAGRTEARVSHVSICPTAVDFCKKRIVIADSFTNYTALASAPVDLLIISGNAKFRMDDIENVFNVVLDASVPSWKAEKIKADCKRLHISCYNVVENGAFVMNPDCLPLPPPG